MDPVYEYVAGWGWVPKSEQYCETYTTILCRGTRPYKVTIFRRAPKSGERGWYTYSDKQTLEEVAKELTWQIHDGEGAFAWTYDSRYGSRPPSPGDLVVTVLTEVP